MYNLETIKPKIDKELKILGLERGMSVDMYCDLGECVEKIKVSLIHELFNVETGEIHLVWIIKNRGPFPPYLRIPTQRLQKTDRGFSANSGILYIFDINKYK